MVTGIEVKTSSDVLHHLQHSSLYVTGKESIKAVAHSLSSETTRNSLGAGTAAAAGTALSSVVLIGGVSAVSAGLTQMDYIHERKEIKNLYRDELAAKLRKSKDDLTDKDLQVLAKGDPAKGIQQNHTIAEALDKSRKKRNLGVVLSVVASLASLAVVGALGFPHPTLIQFAANIAIGLGAYHLVKKPMHWVADKIFGHDKVTANDKIMEMEKELEAGKSISREQVFSVFVSANPQLDEYIMAQLGRSYNALNIEDKRRVADSMGTAMNIQQFSDAINNGQVNVTELAFAAEGQRSGVLPREFTVQEEKPGFVRGLVNRVTGLVRRKEAHHEHVPAVAHAPQPQNRMPVEYNNPVPEVSFVERLGRAPVVRRPSYTEQVVDSRDQAVIPQPQV
ncbi:MAG: hypothetical protein SFT92_07035 [Rickettsiales bacterium]|nr:hypothetical protein [Rickettsiales bacterium]